MSQSIARRSSRARNNFPFRSIDPHDPHRLRISARREAEMIAAALVNTPPLDRHAMALNASPFNEIAGAEPVAAVIERLVRRRIPGNPWLAIHGPMRLTDQSGDGYWAWADAFRDAAFLVGVDYALRSIPHLLPWLWPDDQRLADEGGAR